MICCLRRRKKKTGCVEKYCFGVCTIGGANIIVVGWKSLEDSHWSPDVVQKGKKKEGWTDGRKRQNCQSWSSPGRAETLPRRAAVQMDQREPVSLHHEAPADWFRVCVASWTNQLLLTDWSGNKRRGAVFHQIDIPKKLKLQASRGIMTGVQAASWF